jgi:hypothetical protein
MKYAFGWGQKANKDKKEQLFQGCGMDAKGNADKNTDLALTGMGALAKLVSIKLPPANALAIIVDIIKDLRTKKHLDRLEKLIQCLDRRLTQVEDKIPETPDLDLFDEIVAKAVSDEDEDKTELYAALVQYWIEHKPAPYEVRLLGNALKELTIQEITSFSGFIISQGPDIIKTMPEQLQEVFWNRVEYLGLFKGGMVKAAVNVTHIGREFVEIFQLSLIYK